VCTLAPSGAKLHTRQHELTHERKKMKILNPDATATYVHKTDVLGEEVELVLKRGLTLRESNAILGYLRYGEIHEANVYGVSAILKDIKTPVEDEEGNTIAELPRDETEVDGVKLISEGFLEGMPRLLFIEVARLSISMATGSRITDDDAKN
jgi:hypothetical protein